MKKIEKKSTKEESMEQNQTAMSYDDKVELAQKAKKQYAKMDDEAITKEELSEWFKRYYVKIGYKPLCRIILGKETLVKKPKNVVDDED